MNESQIFYVCTYLTRVKLFKLHATSYCTTAIYSHNSYNNKKTKIPEL